MEIETKDALKKLYVLLNQAEMRLEYAKGLVSEAEHAIESLNKRIDATLAHGSCDRIQDNDEPSWAEH